LFNAFLEGQIKIIGYQKLVIADVVRNVNVVVVLMVVIVAFYYQLWL
jgi:hypothetical protein